MAAAPLKLLVVDDSPEDRELYRRLLRADTERSYEFLEAQLGEEGLRRCEEDAPDCVLLDYRLPDLDGVEFLSRLAPSGTAPRIPVIVLTGQGSEAVAVSAMKAGAQDYLLKGSFGADILGRSVQNAIEKVQLLQRIERRTAQLAGANEELLHEVEQRRRAEEALQKMADGLERLVQERTAELSRANRSKDEFLATVSHELRTPLNAILGWTQILRQGVVPADTHARALETIERNARWQMRLIDDILDVSRIVAGNLRLDLAPLDLAALIESAVDVVRPGAVAKGVALTLDVPGPAPISGDADRLRQVIWNVLSNAVKFTPAGGRVDVRLRSRDSAYEVSVSDTGAGIAPAFLPFVFDPFRQADASTTRRHGGLGLGLAIGRQLVELHGGHISAHSEGEGRGATFTVRLPGQQASATTAAPRVPRVPRQSRNLDGLRVLAIDDDADARELLVAVLEPHGANVVTAASADEALRSLIDLRPHVVLSDIGMPDLDGYELIRRMRALDSDEARRVPAVAVTAYAGEIDRRRALEAGFQAHVSKPIDAAQLVQLVQRLTATD
jgi:signal transduction histidine kinase